jgi:hypothetical protein
MSQDNRYGIVVYLVAAQANAPPFKPWAWEICRDGEPLPARIRESGFKTEHTAKLAASCLVSRANKPIPIGSGLSEQPGIQSERDCRHAPDRRNIGMGVVDQYILVGRSDQRNDD